jgi:hypothetical protein
MGADCSEAGDEGLDELEVMGDSVSAFTTMVSMVCRVCGKRVAWDEEIAMFSILKFLASKVRVTEDNGGEDENERRK